MPSCFLTKKLYLTFSTPSKPLVNVLDPLFANKDSKKESIILALAPLTDV